MLDFGGQYNQLSARRVREHNVFCEVKPYKTSIEEIKAMNPIGIIFTGGPNSVYEETSPKCDPALFDLGIPVLGICYGCQLMAHTLGGQVTAAQEVFTFSAPIFSSLSMVRMTSPAFSVRPRMAKKPLSTLRLLMRILKRSRPSEVKVL